jgi:hypothetical protein
LTFGIDGIERRPVLDTARQARDHGQAATRLRDVKTLEVVHQGAPDDDLREQHSGRMLRICSWRAKGWKEVIWLPLRLEWMGQRALFERNRG